MTSPENGVIKIISTLTVTETRQLSDYEDLSIDEAIEYEKDLSEQEKIQYLVEALEFGAEYELQTQVRFEPLNENLT